MYMAKFGQDVHEWPGRTSAFNSFSSPNDNDALRRLSNYEHEKTAMTIGVALVQTSSRLVFVEYFDIKPLDHFEISSNTSVVLNPSK